MFSFFLFPSFPTKPDSLFLTLSAETGKDDDDNRCENVHVFVVKIILCYCSVARYYK